MSVRTLLKYTFADLLVKQVLQLQDTQESNPDDRTLRYVQAGQKFANYTWHEHEYPFLQVFIKSPGIRVLFKNFIRIVKEKTTIFPSRYRKTIMRSPRIEPLIRVGLIGWLLNDFKYTPAGQAQRAQMLNEIKELEATLPDLLTNDQNKAREILRALGGNIYLLAGIDLLLLHEIDAAFEQSTPALYDTSTSTSSGIDSPSHSDHHGHGHSNDWGDSGYSSDSGDSGSSGCSGDSGCSSGCGGCGGD